MRRLVFGLAIVLAVVGSAQAAPLYDNLSNPSSSTSGDGIDASVLGPLADSFSTQSLAYVFGDLKLVLRKSGETQGASITVNLLADNATTPGSLISVLGAILDGALSGTPSIIDLSFAPINLAANTRYWIQLSTTPGAKGEWMYAADQNGIGSAAEFFSNDTGTNPNTLGPYLMAINGPSGVPEPVTLSLFGAGLIGAVALRRKKAWGGSS